MKSSLLKRWLLTYASVSILVVAICSAGAWVYASSMAQRFFHDRVDSVSKVLGRPAFPLTNQVLSTIALLTQTELILVDSSGKVLATTTELVPRDGIPNLSRFQLPSYQCEWTSVTMSNRQLTTTNAQAPDSALHLGILVPLKQLSQARIQAASTPMITGGFLTFAFAAVATYQFSRIVRRIGQIENQVQRIGARDYSSSIKMSPNDELGRLIAGIDCMAEQLQSSEQTLRETERERLVLQLSRGLAHDFRNALAGVRLAIQTYQRENPSTDHEPLKIASNQLRNAESLLGRLICTQSSGQDASTSNPSIEAVILDTLSLLQPMVDHWRVKMSVDISPEIGCFPSLHAEALSSLVFNLVLNAIQAAGENGHLWLHCAANAETGCLSVQDSGPGPARDIVDRMYEPMVSTKPEGLGMGLFVARQAATLLGGEIVWKRENERTAFMFTFPLENS